MKNKALQICDTTIYPGEILSLALPLPELFSCAPLYMPIKIIHGKKAGPCLLVTAAMQGDELNGTEITDPFGSAYYIAYVAMQIPVGVLTDKFGVKWIMLFDTFLPPTVSYFIYLSAGAHATSLKPENFIVGFTFMPALYLISFFVAAFLIRETYCKPQKEAIKLSIDS